MDIWKKARHQEHITVEQRAPHSKDSLKITCRVVFLFLKVSKTSEMRYISWINVVRSVSLCTTHATILTASLKQFKTFLIIFLPFFIVSKYRTCLHSLYTETHLCVPNTTDRKSECKQKSILVALAEDFEWFKINIKQQNTCRKQSSKCFYLRYVYWHCIFCLFLDSNLLFTSVHESGSVFGFSGNRN